MSPSPPQASPSGSSTSRPHQKRCRLSVACNQVRLPAYAPVWPLEQSINTALPTQCRKRKVRCDTTLPKCKNCVLRNEHCETSDPRDPEKGPTVRVATKGAHAPEAWRPPTPRSGSERHRRSVDGSRASLPRETRDVAETEAEGDLSWVSRAYQASVIENQCESISGSTPDVVINTDDTTAQRVKASVGSLQTHWV